MIVKTGCWARRGLLHPSLCFRVCSTRPTMVARGAAVAPAPTSRVFSGLSCFVPEGQGPRLLPVLSDQTPLWLHCTDTVKHPDFTAGSFTRHTANSPVLSASFDDLQQFEGLGHLCPWPS